MLPHAENRIQMILYLCVSVFACDLILSILHLLGLLFIDYILKYFSV